jgi:hypothetical protein
MNHLQNHFGVCAVACAAALGALLWLSSQSNRSAMADEQARAKPAAEPVDDSMHHFMEYIYEPAFKRLKPALAKDPADKQAWKAIKGDALTVAECANLLLARAPDEGGDAWRELSVAVRTDGGALYQAARQSDYAAARAAYRKMINNCNACHTKFADGKHQLEP